MTDSAPEGVFIKQPDPGQELGAMSSDELRAYLAQTGYAQGGDYTASDTANGLVGKYNMSAESLVDMGYLKSASDLNNPNLWTGKDNINNIADFKNNGAIQESVMFSKTQNDYAQLQASGAITQNTSVDVVAGLLSASHVSTPTTAVNWLRGGDDSAVNNVSKQISQAFNQGKYSQSQVALIKTSNQYSNYGVS